jgi:TRAP-type mannitol/chloroaromatic compound transport system permease small subunit
MGVLRRLVAVIDWFNDLTGRWVAWLTLGTVLVCFAVVVLRYAFSIGFIWMQDLYVWMHAVVFLLGAGYTFRNGGHVRVDILYGRASPTRKAWVDIVGTLIFLFPWLAVLAWDSQGFILGSWQLKESSQQTGGMPGMYLLKAGIWVFCILVGLQGLALLSRSILFLRGDAHYAPNNAGH